MGMALGLAALGLTSASASACPNEALRSELSSGQLPDCRAYELVSPVYKGGVFVSSAFAVSAKGTSFLAGSLGAFGGTEGDGLGSGTNLLGASYLFSRNESAGWTAASLEPPDSRFRSNGFFDASADLSTTLWELGTLEPEQTEGVTDFYREQPRGTFVEIGPPTPGAAVVNNNSYAYLGSSEKLTHVLFTVKPEFRWPFDDTTGASRTLYEYVGVEHPGEARKPSLVGVTGDRDSTALISQCGTRLGSSSPEYDLSWPENGVAGSMYNAISAEGSRIFFTAVGEDDHVCGAAQPPVDELWTREELLAPGEEPPAAHMRAVPISEPMKEDCRACLTGGAVKDAVFQGASLDGSKVYFTTEQELLPGAVGENLYEYDFNAPPEEKVTRLSETSAGEAEVQGVARISEDGSHVYFVAKGVLTGAPNTRGDSAEAGKDNLYVYERDAQFSDGRLLFIATLSLQDSSDWSRNDERAVLASHDGRYLVFISGADLAGEGLSLEKPQVFQFDAVTDRLVRASIGQNGYDQNGTAPIAGSEIVAHFPSAYSYVKVDSPASANGVQAPENGAVFFESPDALAPGALADRVDSAGTLVPNIYEYRAGSIYLLSDGKDISTISSSPGVSLIGSDPSGSNVFFYTADPLIARDGDTEQDIYDAREEGGIPSPTEPFACVGEACRSGLSGVPALAPISGSATQGAEAEASPAVATRPVVKKVSPRRKPVKKKKKTRKAQAGRKARRAAVDSHLPGVITSQRRAR